MALVGEYPEVEALRQETIYALPLELISVIQAKLPDFFSEREIRFERDLTRGAKLGFHWRRSIDYEYFDEAYIILQDSDPDEIPWDDPLGLDDYFEHDQQPVSYELDDDEYLAQRRFEDELNYEQELDETVHDIQRGYLGWLVSDSAFRRERDRLRERWGQGIAEAGRFPTLPSDSAAVTAQQSVDESNSLQAEFNAFYQRWGLSSMVTWELPRPMRPELNSEVRHPLSSLREAGLVLFLPWHLLRNQEFDLRDLTYNRMHARCPAHLQGWLEKEPANWSYLRFYQMLRLYVHLELALRSRYRERLRGLAPALDVVFGHFMYNVPVSRERQGLSAGYSIEKIHKEMQRRLTAM